MYREHRSRFLARLRQEGAAAVIPTNSPKTRNHDCEYRFRPHSDFWYLTGFAEPGAVLVLLPARTSEEQDRTVLFLRERDAKLETWNGRRLGLERAPEVLGVDEARDVEEVWDELPNLLKGYERIVYHTGTDEDNDREMVQVINRTRSKARGGIRPPIELIDTLPYLHEQRLFKTAAELDLMRRAAAITTEAHLAAMRATEPGKNEQEIDALLDYTFRKRGSTGQAYNNIVAGGDNACILHYVENNMELADGDLLLIDAGAECEYYASDVTRTFPVNGTFTPDQRALYEVVLAAQLAGIEAVKPGTTFIEVHETAREHLVRGLVQLGILSGDVDELIEAEAYTPYFMHKTSHWLGLDVHDCGFYTVDDKSRTLEAGMVLTIEPGLYIALDAEDVDERWRGLGVRIEDDVLVTADGHEVLTSAIPKSVEDVEAACKNARLASVS